MEYLFILILIACITLFLENKYKIHPCHTLNERLILVMLFFAIGVLWDSYAICRQDWIFPEDKTLGIKIGLMPLEEYLLILIVPYSILTVYMLVDSKFGKQKIRKIKKK